MYVCARVGRNNTPELRAQNKVTKVVATWKQADSTRYKYLQNNVCMCKGIQTQAQKSSVQVPRGTEERDKVCQPRGQLPGEKGSLNVAPMTA